jgi:ABC-type lipoprotein release transport system permease subunit
MWVALGELWVAASYVAHDIRMNRRDLLIAFMVIVMTVTALICGYSLIEKGPLVFVKVTENMVGEFDLVLTAAPGEVLSRDHGNGTGPYAALSASPLLLNGTEALARVRAGAGDVSTGAAPRWTMVGRAVHRFDPARNITAVLVAMDLELEAELGIGRSWNYRALGDREAYVSAALLHALGVEAGTGERLVLDINLGRILSSVGLPADRVRDALRDAFVIGARAALNGSQIVLDLSNATSVQLTLERVFNASIPLPLVQGIIASIGSNRTVPLAEVVTDAMLDQVFAALFPGLDQLRGQVEVVVAGAVDQPYGKWPQVLGNVVVLSSRWLPLMLSDVLPQNLKQNPQLLLNALMGLPGYRPPPTVTVDSVLYAIPLAEYAMTLVVPFRDRLDAYLQSEADDRNRLVMAWSNSVAKAIGWDAPIKYTTPVNDYMVGLDILRQLLQALYDICLVILFFYCGMVIYSLMVANAETKTYEFGMLRALGMRTDALIELMLVQALFYAIPAIAVSVPLSYLANFPVQFGVSYYTSTPLDMSLSFVGMMIGFSVGLAMPIVANIVPIRRALSRTLRDALDLYHSVSNESVIRIQRLEEMGVSPMQLLMAMMVSGMCFLFLYVYPWAFEYLKFGVVFFLTDMIYIGLMVGLSMFFGVLQEKFEFLFMYLLLSPFAFTRTVMPLVRKSLAAHNGRNRKTAVMVTVVATFVIFAGVSLKLETTTAENGYRVLVGSHLLFYSLFQANPLNEADMRPFLETQTVAYRAALEAAGNASSVFTGAVEGYGFVTYSMGTIPGYLDTQLSNILGLPSNPVFLFGIESNYLSTIYDDLVYLKDYDEALSYNSTPAGLPDFLQSLETQRGRARIALDDYLPEAQPSFGVGEALGGGVPLFGVPEGGVYANYIDAVVSKAEEGGDVYFGEPMALRVGFQMTGGDTETIFAPSLNYLVKARATVSKLPGFVFSWIKASAFIGQPCIVDMDTFRAVQRDVWQRRLLLHQRYGLELAPSLARPPEEPPKQFLHVKFAEDASDADRQYVINQLRSHVPNDTTFASDTTDLLAVIDSVMQLLQFFFMAGIVIMDLLCFFVLWITCYSNIHEAQWEFGVLRALGLNANQVISIYVLEMMIITTASLVSGSVIGLLLSVTLTLQNNMWGDWPFQFYFPYHILGFLALVTWAITLLGSWIPARALAQRNISNVLRG